MRQGEGLRVWFGTHSREEMEGEGKKEHKENSSYKQRFAQVTRKEWKPFEFPSKGKGKNSFIQGNDCI